MNNSYVLPRILLDSTTNKPDKTFLSYEGREIGRREVADSALRVAGFLQRADFSPGDRVGIMMTNRPEFLYAWFGTNLAGLVMVPLNIALRGPDLAYQVEHSRLKALFIEASLLPVLQALDNRRGGNLQMVIVAGGPAPTGEVLMEDALSGAPGELYANLGPNSEMEVIYTSGTTSWPKGVICLHASMTVVARGVSRHLGLQADDRLMVVHPLFHGNAQLSVAMALVTGASLLLVPRFSVSGFWKAARDGGATQVNLLGPLLAMIATPPPAADDAQNPIRVVFSAATPKHLHEEFERRFDVVVVEGYGLTETGINLMNPVDRYRRKVGTIGLPLPYNEVAILDEELRPLPPGEPGEICVRPLGELKEYWAIKYFEDAEATSALWRGGWLHTGDQGVADAEGFVTFIDRLKDVIRRRGENISSQQVEQALLEHPRVLDAAVVGIPAVVGEEDVMALIVPREPVLPEELAEFCRARLADFKIPTWYKFVEAVPKTATGRVKKVSLKKDPDLLKGAVNIVPVASSRR